MSKYKQGELLCATYDVWIKGKKLGLYKKSCITSIEIEETTEGADTMVINISDPNFEYIEDNIFLEDTRIKVKLGWDGETYRSTFSGWIATIDISFNEDGTPTLTINCMDDTHRMNRKKKSKTWNNMSSAQVVQQIVQKYGFKFVTDSKYKFTKQETITQSNQTDIDFIQSLAGEETDIFTARLVDNKTFYYVKKGQLGKSVATLNYVQYPHEVISFSPQINIETRQESVSTGTVGDDKKASTTILKSGNTNEKVKSGGGGSGSSGNVTYSLHTGAYSQ